ncbi:MAG: AbrB/MazE/SpoVT family DNA-binding domain-containing protein [Candidatus Nitrosocosmicus sp.]|nr:AbrB/MazE/SpoVT family DNA-binding domain-containing protein [Candidatus Nitrosocosmicus sp.]MDN5868945.1 AbrB/MazE/SpoVT family DNA-binding domain-containing protein [Candidatus Nitrosocosmicus sp.]
MSEKHGDITNLTKANTRSNSLRTTIPMSITNQFGLKEGDKLSWQIEANNNNLIIKIKPLLEKLR